MTTHTPGPWRHAGERYGRLVDSCGVVIVDLPSSNHPAVDAQIAANARLIAAAPDLLSAAKDFTEAFGSGEFDDPMKVMPYIDRFNAAIAKAQP